jgi:hypothetical protein
MMGDLCIGIIGHVRLRLAQCCLLRLVFIYRPIRQYLYTSLLEVCSIAKEARKETIGPIYIWRISTRRIRNHRAWSLRGLVVVHAWCVLYCTHQTATLSQEFFHWLLSAWWQELSFRFVFFYFTYLLFIDFPIVAIYWICGQGGGPET